MIAEVSYRLAQLALRAFTPVLAVGEGKLARGLRGRRGAHERLIWWGRSVRDPDRPTVWFHAPSVGEGLQARAVMDALRRRRPEFQIVFTHFSPSASALAADLPADVADYLPWDVPSDAGVVLQALAPGLLVFTKTEIWPFTVAAASADEVPVAMIAGTRRTSSDAVAGGPTSRPNTSNVPMAWKLATMLRASSASKAA